MPMPARRLFNSQSDIWDAHEPVDGEFVLLPVGIPDPVVTSQTILLASDPSSGQEGYATAGQNWSPKPLSSPFGTLQAGEDFFPFYRNGVFWYTRQIKSMVLNGILFDSTVPAHRFAMTLTPGDATFGFYQINLNSGPPATIFAAIRNLVAGQVLTITDITLATS